MGLSQIVAGVTVFLTGLMPMSCHKAATTAKTQSPSSTVSTNLAASNSPQHDLGMVALTNHMETCLKLGGGKDCTFIPHMVDNHTVELTLQLESKSPAGALQDVSVTQVTAKTGQPLEVAVGDFQLSLTPSISNE